MAQEAFALNEVFILRTPLLPIEVFTAWTKTAVETLDGAAAADTGAKSLAPFREFLAIPLVQDAVYAASRDAWLAIAQASAGELSTKQADRLRVMLASYLARMTSRPTPFGLCAGYSIGRCADHTALELPARDSYTCHSELDFAEVNALSARATARDASRAMFVREPLTYSVAGRWRFVRRHVDEDGQLSHRLSEAEQGPALDALLAHASVPRTWDELVAHVQALHVRRARPQAQIDGYLRQIIAAGLLRPIAVSLLDERPLETLISRASGSLDTENDAARWRTVSQELATIDAQRAGSRAASYDATLRKMHPGTNELPRLNITLAKRASGLHLSRRVYDALRTAVRLLHDITEPQAEPSIERFAERFTGRYGDEEVPLLQALDQDFGIGFQPEAAPESAGGPFAERLLASPKWRSKDATWTAREAFLLERLHRLSRESGAELELSSTDLSALHARVRRPLPSSFHVRASLAANSSASVDSGDFRLLIRECYGPPAGRLFARFCHRDPELRAHVNALSAMESSRHGDAIVAEVIYESRGKGVNVQRRAFTPDAIIALTPMVTADDTLVIVPSDLTVSVRGESVLLRCPRLDRWVVPRINSAHVYARRSLPIYRFLHALQRHGYSASLKWEWGALDECSFLPRVRTGRLVLERASWRLSGEATASLKRLPRKARRDWLLAWAAAQRVARQVVLCDGDRELLVDFANPMSVDMLSAHLASLAVDGPIRLAEWFPAAADMCVTGPEGTYAHEIIVTGLSTDAQPPVRRDQTPPRFGSTRATPFSDWLYFRIYCGPQIADRLLLTLPTSLAEVFGATPRDWFYIRYSDPEPHLRVRFQAQSTEMMKTLVDVVSRILSGHPCRDGIFKWELGTYVREVVRYGGPTAMPLAEAVFCADSQWVLSILGQLAERRRLNDGVARWQAAILGVHRLFVEFGLSVRERLDVCRSWRAFGDQRCAIDRTSRHALGRMFAEHRGHLIGLMRPDGMLEGIHVDAGVVQQRQVALRAYAEVLAASTAPNAIDSRRDIALSLAHMCSNRTFDALDPTLELSVSDALYRLYDASLSGKMSCE